MVVMNDTTIRADRNVYTRLLIVFVTLTADIDQCRCLTTADPLGLTRDADGAATDTDFDKVRAGLSQETEAFAVDYVAGADLDILTEVLVDVFQRDTLPLREAFRGINAQDIRASLYEGRDTLCIVTGVDTSTDDVALILIDELQLMFFVVIVVLTEYHVGRR